MQSVNRRAIGMPVRLCAAVVGLHVEANGNGLAIWVAQLPVARFWFHGHTLGRN